MKTAFEALRDADGYVTKIRRDGELRRWNYYQRDKVSQWFSSYHAAMRHRNHYRMHCAITFCEGGARALWKCRHMDGFPKWLVPILRAHIRREEKIPRKKWEWTPEARERFARAKTGVRRLALRNEREARLTLLLIAAL